ncbi:hypothetical protein [Arthrobacter sp. UYEF3]|uniref:hypothetical protein n=1 Tax=Arthrobacter sp. UYEF3 TaxID=1756365 RepID=UPI0033987F17
MATAERLGVKDTPGITVGRVVSTGQKFIQPWEDLSIDIWGPRTGKSTSRVMPAILDAPGAVVSTSNKRDVVDGTRSVRGGTAPEWVFDPQKIAQEEPAWWWNPLSVQAHPALRRRLADSRVQTGRVLRSQGRRHPVLLLPRRRAGGAAHHAGLPVGD